MYMYMSMCIYIYANKSPVQLSSWPPSGSVRVGTPEAAEALHAAGGQTSAVWHQLPAKQRRKAGRASADGETRLVMPAKNVDNTGEQNVKY